MANYSLRDRGDFNRTELGVVCLAGRVMKEGAVWTRYCCLAVVTNATYCLSLLISTCYRTRLLDYYPSDQERAWILGKR